MKKIIPFTFVALLAAFSVQAQDENPYREVSKESEEYHDFRVMESEPPYSLKKIQSLIKGIKYNEENETGKLSPKVYQGLSVREKFTYHMIHPESFSQICDAYPPIQDEHKKIFGQLPDLYDEWAWSERQIAFFKTNRDSVIKLMKECITKTNQIGVNFKKAIVEMNATEMIPFLITCCKTINKDHDILTILLLLMKHNKYPPFMASISHNKLYSENSDYQSFLVYNKANENLIFQRATDFYNGLKH